MLQYCQFQTRGSYRRLLFDSPLKHAALEIAGKWSVVSVHS